MRILCSELNCFGKTFFCIQTKRYKILTLFVIYFAIGFLQIEVGFLYLYGLGHNQNSNGGETSVVDSLCKEPKSKYIFYSESIMFDKMLERKLINYMDHANKCP